jgi:small Trp-rich protein
MCATERRAPYLETENPAMWFLMLGLLGVVLKYLEISVFATLSWWIVLIPFALAVAWWSWADASGYTKRRVMEREDERRQDRIDRQRSNLGMLNRSNRRK